MATVNTVSPKELERIANLAYVGKTLKVMLCKTTLASQYTIANTVAEWQSIELSGNGYVRFSQVIGAGSYNSTTARFELPQFIVPFTATSAYSYDYVVLYLDGETYVHSLIQEIPNISLASNQTQTYKILLAQDD